ncbi:MAG: T9SS type A sorting domain-containing protein, partial [Flavobacteriales bacterium]|nr:T9SS type A sorting domain-containing protein [Flavobacteriales bacterium]
KTNFSIYPNPATNNLTLLLNHNKTEILTVEIYNIAGKVVQKKQLTTNAGVQQYNFNISDLSSGFYVLSIHSDNFKLTQKFVKQ